MSNYPYLESLSNWPGLSSEAKAEITQALEKLRGIISTGIRSLTDAFVAIARDKNFPLAYANEYGVDGDIFAWLPNATVTDVPPPAGTYQPVDTQKGTNEATIQKSAVKMSLSQAIVQFTQDLQSGVFDQKETYRIIFLEETRDGKPLKLCCSRYSDGELNLNVYEVDPDDVWDDPGGAWFASNEH